MEMNLSGINTNTVSITDFKIVATKVARVVIAFTGRMTPESITASLGEQLQHLAIPVEKSFRIIKDNVAVGFVRANVEVRAVADEKELRAGYKTMAKNILMDNKDKTLWDVKEGAAGKFLARHGNEDLSELVEAATTHRTGIPRLNQLATATAAPRELVAFVSTAGDMDYGFCLAAKADKLKVFSSTSCTEVIVPVEAVATVLPKGAAKIPLSVHKRITEAGISREDAKQEKEYYTRLFSYAPEYLADIKEMVDSTAVM
jgi:hypothetical protein